MISDAVNSNWSVARDTVKDTVSIGVAHAEAALMPAVEPIVEQAKASGPCAENDARRARESVCRQNNALDV